MSLKDAHIGAGRAVGKLYSRVWPGAQPPLQTLQDGTRGTRSRREKHRSGTLARQKCDCGCHRATLSREVRPWLTRGETLAHAQCDSGAQEVGPRAGAGRTGRCERTVRHPNAPHGSRKTLSCPRPLIADRSAAPFSPNRQAGRSLRAILQNLRSQPAPHLREARPATDRHRPSSRQTRPSHRR